MVKPTKLFLREYVYFIFFIVYKIILEYNNFQTGLTLF